MGIFRRDNGTNGNPGADPRARSKNPGARRR